MWVYNADCCDLVNQAPEVETKRGVISPTKLKNGSIDLDLTPATKKQVDDIAKHGDSGGYKTEALFEDVVKEHGGTVLSGASMAVTMVMTMWLFLKTKMATLI